MKQSERSKQWMVDALLQLLQTKQYADITIKDITDKAGVSRLTFYRNFESKDAILQTYYETGFQKYLDTIDEDKTNLEYALTQYYTFWKCFVDKKAFFTQSNLMSFMFQSFDKYLQIVLEHAGLESRFTHFQKKFIVGGLSASMLDWVNNDMNITPNKIAKEVLMMIDLENDD